MKRHPLAVKYLPEPTQEEIQSIKASLNEYGFDKRYPVWMYEGKVLVGWTRCLAATELKINVVAKEYEGDDPAGFMAMSELPRRHLSMVQRLRIAENLRPELEKSAKLRQKDGGLAQKCAKVSDTVAAAAGVSTRTAENFHAVEVNGTPALKKAVSSEVISISDAAKVATEPAEVQAEVVKAVRTGQTKTAAAAAKKKKSGSVKFDDRKIQDLFGKLQRLLGQRKDALGGNTQYEECASALNGFWSAFKRWQRVTT